MPSQFSQLNDYLVSIYGGNYTLQKGLGTDGIWYFSTFTLDFFKYG